MVKAKKIVNSTRFAGEPKLTDFTLVEEELPPLKDGEFLAEGIYYSVDPYMRPYMGAYPVGSLMIGSQIAKVIATKNTDYPVGSIVFGEFGWRTHTITTSKKAPTALFNTYKLPSFGKHPISLGLSTLGMPGNTAYFGFLRVCQPKAGEVVVVSGAAGAVGYVVGQIAKIKGCKVIGIAGSADKCDWLTKELGFDVAINYKTEDIAQALKAAAPDGIDCYFDNVGGETTSIVVKHMKKFGRISVCGSISSYNNTEATKVDCPQMHFVGKQLRMEGFVVTNYIDEWFDGINVLLKWVEAGQIKYRETVTDGFENMPQAFIDMLRGKNTGKAIVKA